MPNSFTKAHRDEERNGACDASSVWWKDITSAAQVSLDSFIGGESDTVDGINPAPPGMVKTL